MKLGDLDVETDWKTCRGQPSVIARRGGVEVWRRQLRVTDGRRDLWPRCEPPRELGGQILIASDGEHTRASQSFEPRLHLLSPEGELRWTRRWRLMAEPQVVEGELFLLVRGRDFHHASDGPMAWLLCVELLTGRALRRWPLRADDGLRERFRGARCRSLSGELLARDALVTARLSLHAEGIRERLEATSDDPDDGSGGEEPLISC